jgi:hypothetical protein
MTALLDDVAQRIAPAYKPLALGAPKVMRIYRDVRFSKDKAPYKTHIGAVITVAGKKIGEDGNAAMYVHLGVEEEFIGVGCYRFDAAKLATWRKAVAGKLGAQLAPLIAKLRKAGYAVGGHDDYRRCRPASARSSTRRSAQGTRLTGGFLGDPAGLLHKAGPARLASEAWQSDGTAGDLAAPQRRLARRRTLARLCRSLRHSAVLGRSRRAWPHSSVG